MDDYWISIMSEPILGVSHQIVLATFVSGKTPILWASMQVRQLLTGRSTQDNQRAFATRHLPRECHLIVYDTGGSSRGRRRKETVTLYQHPRDTKTVQYWILATSKRWHGTPSTSRKWWQVSTVNH